VTRELQDSYWEKREKGWHGTRVDDILEAPAHTAGAG
jgi:hypothetical protein